MGPHDLFIDHTAPICSILGIPLLTKSPKAKFTYERLYPGLQCQIKNWDLGYLLENYSTVFYGFRPTPSFAQKITEQQQKEPQNPLWHQKTQFIYHLHGCSDKGYHSSWISPNSHFLDVDQVLFYGERMRDIFKDHFVLEKLRAHTFVGNYRYSYYLKHRSFYQKLVEKEVFSQFKKKQETWLYAPSWVDPENSCSLFKACAPLLKNFPENKNLILKLHPFLTLKAQGYDPNPLLELLEPLKKRPNMLLLTNWPLIYPILDQVSAYIGDYSSIGYDALSFNLPLFFLNHNQRDLEDKGAYLHRCGRVISSENFENFFSFLKKDRILHSHFHKMQDEVYHYGFGEKLSFEETKKRFQNLLKHPQSTSSL